MDQPSSYPQVRRTKDGQVQLIVLLDLSREITATMLISPEALSDIASLSAGEGAKKLGEAIYWQAFLAEAMLSAQQAPLPSPLQRRRTDAALKHAVSIVAKRIHVFVKDQLRHPQTQTPAFRRAVQAIRDTDNSSPRAIDVTAWFAEHFLGEEVWTEARLRRPTRDPAQFAKTYLYTGPRVSQGPEALVVGESLVEDIVATCLLS